MSQSNPGSASRTDCESAEHLAPDPSDLQILEQIGRGEMGHVPVFVARHRPPIHQFFQGRLNDHHLAEDLVQEVFLRAVRAAQAGQFDQRCEQMHNWMFTIARNCLTDHHRRQTTRGRSPSDLAVGPARSVHGSLADATISPLEHIALREQRARVLAQLETLPEVQRDVVRLKAIEGLTFMQIADRLSCPVATVKSRMRYALLKLHERLKKDGDLL